MSYREVKLREILGCTNHSTEVDPAVLSRFVIINIPKSETGTGTKGILVDPGDDNDNELPVRLTVKEALLLSDGDSQAQY